MFPQKQLPTQEEDETQDHGRHFMRVFLKALETTAAINWLKISCNSVGDCWVSDLSRHGHHVLLARNCCSLAVVVTEVFASRSWPAGGVVMSLSLQHWDLGGWIGTLQSRSLSEPKILPVQHWRAEISPKFSTSTGNNFWEISGIFLENYYQYSFLMVLRPCAPAPVVVKISLPVSWLLYFHVLFGGAPLQKGSA